MAFTLVAVCYVLALFLTVVPIVLMVWHIIAFDELKSFNENPIQQCKILNPLVLPEYLFHVLVCSVFLCASQWLSLVLNMPLIAYHVRRYVNRPLMSNPGLYDPTSIMNADVLAYCQYEGLCKLLFYMLTFCYYMYRMIYALVIS